MRLNQDAREININKKQLIEKIIENKKRHIKQYELALIAFKKAALAELAKEKNKILRGQKHLQVALVSPLDRRSEYDKILKIFQWELKDEVTLSQGEFNEYVLDETHEARQAATANSFYASFSNRSKGK